jgi:hypothetical protein
MVLIYIVTQITIQLELRIVVLVGGMVSSITSSVEGLNFGYHGTISNSSNIFGALGNLAVGVGLAVGGIVGGVWAVAIGITAAVATYILWEGVDYLYDKIKEWIFE